MKLLDDGLVVCIFELVVPEDPLPLADQELAKAVLEVAEADTDPVMQGKHILIGLLDLHHLVVRRQRLLYIPTNAVNLIDLDI